MKRQEFTIYCLTFVVLLSQGLCQKATDTSEASTAEPEAEPELRHITVTSILSRPWLVIKDKEARDETKEDDLYEGFIVDLVEEVAKRSQFTYTIAQVIDGKYGAKDEITEKWSGMIGELINDDAQMAAAPLTITEKRKQAVAFTKPWLNVSLAALVPSDSGITTLKQLEEHDTITYGTIQGGSSMEAFRFSTEVTLMDMWNHIGGDHATNVKTTEEGVKMVEEYGNYSFILEKPWAEFYAGCKDDVSMIKESFLPVGGYGFALQKDDRYLKSVDDALDSLREDGTIQELYSKWFQKGDKCSACALTTSLLLLFLTVILPWI